MAALERWAVRRVKAQMDLSALRSIYLASLSPETWLDFMIADHVPTYVNEHCAIHEGVAGEWSTAPRSSSWSHP
jgi:hypothetical protein